MSRDTPPLASPAVTKKARTYARKAADEIEYMTQTEIADALADAWLAGYAAGKRKGAGDGS